jgi:hypothetical protein
MAIREVVYPSGPPRQGVDEALSYSIETTHWISTPTSPSVVVYDVTGTARTNVTSTVMPTNSPTVLGDVITLSLLRALTADHTYRVEVQFTASGNLFECFFLVRAEQ